MKKIERLSTEEVVQRMRKKMGDEMFETYRELLGEENFHLVIEQAKDHIMLEDKKREKRKAVPKTVLDMLWYYLETQGIEYEETDKGYAVWDEDYDGVYEMHFRVDEKKRRVTLTYDLELPIPKDRKRVVSKFLTKINDMLYDENFRIGLCNGHIRWTSSWTLLGETMHCSTPSALIDSIIGSVRMVYPALMDVFYEEESADDAFEMMIDNVNPLLWVLINSRRR